MFVTNRYALGQTLIFVHRELRVHLFHYLQRNRHDDKNRGASDSERGNTRGALDNVRQNGNQAKKYGSNQCYAI